MKDKLVKHNRKKPFFRLKRIFFALIISLGLSAAIAVPVGISVYNDVATHQASR